MKGRRRRERGNKEKTVASGEVMVRGRSWGGKTGGG